MPTPFTNKEIWRFNYFFLNFVRHPELFPAPCAIQRGDSRLNRPTCPGVYMYVLFSRFIHVEKITGRCVHHKKEGANPFNRDECSVAGGKWAPGTDISGHAYLLIYCALIISEEVRSPTYYRVL